MPIENELFIMSNIWGESCALHILISFIGISNPIALFVLSEPIALNTSVL